MKVHPIQSYVDGGKEVRYVSFEFKTPSTHEVTVWLGDNDEPTYAEEIAYGSWYTYKADELDGLPEYMSDHGIELAEVMEKARES